MKSFLFLIIILVLQTFMSTHLYAVESKQYIKFKNAEGDSHTIAVTNYINELGELEIRVDVNGLPRFLNRFNPTILYGRDLSGDGKVDTWFVPTSNGLMPLEFEGKESLGLDIIPKILNKYHPTSLSFYASAATTSVLGLVMLSVSEYKSKEAQFIRDWMNLEDMKLRLQKQIDSPENSLTRSQIQFQYSLIAESYKAMAQDMDRFAKVDFWKWIGADMALWLSSSFLIEKSAHFFAQTTSYLSESALINYIRVEISEFLSKQGKYLNDKAGEISNKFGNYKQKTKDKGLILSFKMSAVQLRASLIAAVTADIAKRKIIKSIQISSQWPLMILKGSMSEWKYISTSTSLQLIAETISHYDEVYDPNPLLMAKNVLTNEDILQNIAFMTTDTILMTGVSKNLTSTKAKLLVSGFIGLHNSTMINLVIKDGDNYKRVALDTAWETIIGNAQVQIDLLALEKFEKMALGQNNPKLKFLGYAVVLINQGSGFYIYSKLSGKMKDSEKKTDDVQIKLIPVLI